MAIPDGILNTYFHYLNMLGEMFHRNQEPTHEPASPSPPPTSSSPPFRTPPSLQDLAECTLIQKGQTEGYEAGFQMGFSLQNWNLEDYTRQQLTFDPNEIYFQSYKENLQSGLMEGISTREDIIFQNLQNGQRASKGVPTPLSPQEINNLTTYANSYILKDSQVSPQDPDWENKFVAYYKPPPPTTTNIEEDWF